MEEGTSELHQVFPDSESARAYLEARRWPDGAVCPACGEAKRIGTRKGGFYRCNACLLDFTVRTGTLFGRSKVPLDKWLYAMRLLVTARKGISSPQLAQQIGVTQKTAWFMLQRMRGTTDEATLQDIFDGSGKKKGRRKRGSGGPKEMQCGTHTMTGAKRPASLRE